MPSLITEAEWTVMAVLWDEHPLSAQDVIARLAKPTGWSATTVKTLLARLVEKNVVDFERDGRRFLYEPRVTRQQAVAKESRSFLDRVFEGEASPLLSFFVKNTKLSPADLVELKKLIVQKEKEREP